MSPSILKSPMSSSSSSFLSTSSSSASSSSSFSSSSSPLFSSSSSSSSSPFHASGLKSLMQNKMERVSREVTESFIGDDGGDIEGGDSVGKDSGADGKTINYNGGDGDNSNNSRDDNDVNSTQNSNHISKIGTLKKNRKIIRKMYARLFNVTDFTSRSLSLDPSFNIKNNENNKNNNNNNRKKSRYNKKDNQLNNKHNNINNMKKNNHKDKNKLRTVSLGSYYGQHPTSVKMPYLGGENNFLEIKRIINSMKKVVKKKIKNKQTGNRKHSDDVIQLKIPLLNMKKRSKRLLLGHFGMEKNANGRWKSKRERVGDGDVNENKKKYINNDDDEEEDDDEKKNGDDDDVNLKYGDKHKHNEGIKKVALNISKSYNKHNKKKIHKSHSNYSINDRLLAETYAGKPSDDSTKNKKYDTQRSKQFTKGKTSGNVENGSIRSNELTTKIITTLNKNNKHTNNNIKKAKPNRRSIDKIFPNPRFNPPPSHTTPTHPQPLLQLQTTYFSTTPFLVIEFNTNGLPLDKSGFAGFFRFIPKGWLKENGEGWKV